MSSGLQDPLGALAGSEFDWAGHTELILDDRYRQRQLPVMHTGVRAPMSGAALNPGEVWPPIRAVVLPLIDPVLHETPAIANFLDDLRRSSISDYVWWDGLGLRSDRTHATVAMPELPTEAVLLSAADAGPLELVIRGPWLGRYNCGRVYLPVELADNRSARAISTIRQDAGVENRPLLSGFLQLTHDLVGPLYRELRDLVREHQRAIAVPMRCQEIWLMDTMDDLVLRSEVVRRYPVRQGSAE